jgi:NADH dehydrogenase FAD-containing subunit
MHAYIDSWRAKFRDARHVVLVGGGAVGAEIAGEIKDEYPVCRNADKLLDLLLLIWISFALGKTSHHCSGFGRPS